jgi:hypothetical protein
MRTTTIRWPDATHAAIARAAAEAGVGFTQYVREAALVRSAWEQGLAAGSLAGPVTPQAQASVVQAAREALAELGT